MKHKIELVRGPEGLALYINDFRVAGPKPWSGGPTVKAWTVDQKDIDQALERATPEGE